VKAAEGLFEDGLEHGLWTFWDEEGESERSVRYDRGAEVA
jgi:antitoxin component YwqK of YwqJK toxin-antitoxin module